MRFHALTRLTATLVTLWAASTAVCAEPVRAALQDETSPRVQIALLLDTSNSMDGLIDQAREQLWSIVNEFSEARMQSAPPRLQVALYEYGNSGLDAQGGYLRQVLPFTRDLDAVSEALFALTTNGGDEYCGAVISDAVAHLEWSREAGDLRVLFIAGNEPFTQGPVDFRTAVREAAQLDIRVNTIHCGPAETGVSGHWLEGAELAGGAYFTIDQNQAVAHIPAPQDARIAELNQQLNRTYLPYGDQGEEKLRRQASNDAAASSISASLVAERARAKSGAYYDNRSWDLGDAVTAGEVELDEIEAEDLPEEMRALSTDEREAFVDAKLEERERLKEEIQALSEKREAFVADERRKLTREEADETLGRAMLDALRDQGEAKQLEF